MRFSVFYLNRRKSQLWQKMLNFRKIREIVPITIENYGIILFLFRLNLQTHHYFLGERVPVVHRRMVRRLWLGSGELIPTRIYLPQTLVEYIDSGVEVPVNDCTAFGAYPLPVRELQMLIDGSAMGARLA